MSDQTTPWNNIIQIWEDILDVFPPLQPSLLCDVTPWNTNTKKTIVSNNLRLIRNTTDYEKEQYNGALGVVFVEAPSNADNQVIYTKESGDFIYQQFEPN